MSLHLAAENEVAGLLRSRKAAPGLIQFLGVSQIAAPRQLFVWEPQTNFMPWATLGQKPMFLDGDATLAAICSNDFSPRQWVYLPTSARGQINAGTDSKARLLSSQFGPSECIFDASAESPTMLVIAQASYHCWQATVDGASVPLWRANHAFQALEIPPGRHEVRIKYVDRAFQAGAIISIIALITCIAALRKNSRGASTAPTT
jgi:hypothetical protein